MENSNPTTVPNIPNHLLIGILTTLFCCLPFGIVSIVYAIQVNSAMTVGNYQLAQIASEKAKFWAMLSLWIGITLNIILLVFYFLIGVIAALA